MKLNVKNGVVLVKPANAADHLPALSAEFHCGEIVHGADSDKGVIVFYKDCVPFADNLCLVKVEDVLVWIKDEVVVVEAVEQVA